MAAIPVDFFGKLGPEIVQSVLENPWKAAGAFWGDQHDSISFLQWPAQVVYDGVRWEAHSGPLFREGHKRYREVND